MLQALAGKCDINTHGREGITAAHMAAMGDNSKLIDFLAEKKANLELFSRHDEGGMTPLMMAAKYGHVYVCADLVRHRVNVNQVRFAFSFSVALYYSIRKLSVVQIRSKLMSSVVVFSSLLLH